MCLTKLKMNWSYIDKITKTFGGSSWAKDLYDIFGSVRKEAKDKAYSEEKIIDTETFLQILEAEEK